MGLAGLDAALSGLRVSQQQINVISNNVANVSTPGFTRKTLPQLSQSIEGVTVGVAPGTIIRKVDLNLSRDLWTQVSAVGYLDVQSTYLSRIEQFHGAPDQELSVAAEISRLKESFSALSDSPDDTFLLSQTVIEAEATAQKINDLSSLLTTLRNDVQADMSDTVERINDLLSQIADLNENIQENLNLRRSTAITEDQRDEAIKELSGLMDVTFFQRGDGVLVVQTNRGVELATTRAQQLNFNPIPVSARSYYPDTARPVYVGDPLTPAAVDITELEPGGKLGGLLALRDQTFPKQMAQLDELAHKLALRCQQQGLELFTDATGSIPADDAPDPTTLPDPTPVSYVGFSAEIRVNQAILDDNTLIQSGTGAFDEPVQPGSNEVIRRIIEYSFGTISHQEAAGSVDIRAAATGATTMQQWLGIFSENDVTGARDVASITDVATLVTSANGALDDPNDVFEITFADARTGQPAATVTIDLSAVPPLGGAITNAADQIVSLINTQIAAVPVPAIFASQARVDANGRIVVESRANITIAAAQPGVANGMGQAGLDFLGLSAGTTMTTDPYFDVQVGNSPSVRITIEPGDTETDLEDKLDFGGTVQGVAGLEVTVDPATGFLTLRPGGDDTGAAGTDGRQFGGDIRIVAGPYRTDGTGTVGHPSGISLVSALFGSFSLGPPVAETSPLADVEYGSETDASATPPIPTLPFREGLLGPGANISINIVGASSLEDFAQRMVSEQSSEITRIAARKADEQSLQDLLQTQLLDESGINIDEELSNLIVYQTGYSAAARVISAVDDMFKELLNAFI